MKKSWRKWRDSSTTRLVLIFGTFYKYNNFLLNKPTCNSNSNQTIPLLIFPLDQNFIFYKSIKILKKKNYFYSRIKGTTNFMVTPTIERQTIKVCVCIVHSNTEGNNQLLHTIIENGRNFRRIHKTTIFHGITGRSISKATHQKIIK